MYEPTPLHTKPSHRVADTRSYFIYILFLRTQNPQLNADDAELVAYVA